MDELVRLLSQKVGMSEDMARQTVDTVLDYLKDKLPALPLAYSLHCYGGKRYRCMIIKAYLLMACDRLLAAFKEAA